MVSELLVDCDFGLRLCLMPVPVLHSEGNSIWHNCGRPTQSCLESLSDTKRFMADVKNSRQLTHPTLSRQSPRRLLLPQHSYLLPPLRPRHCRLGIPRLHGLGFLNLQPAPRQAPQHRATRPFPASKSTLQRLGRILLHRIINPRNP